MIGRYWRDTVHYDTLSLLTVEFLSYTGKGRFIDSLIALLKDFDVFEAKWNILQKWTYKIDSQSCANIALGLIYSVGDSKNIIFMFSRLILLPE
jgi:hypothetical protein